MSALSGPVMTEDQEQLLHQSGSGGLFMRPWLMGAALYDERNLDQESVTKVQFWTKTLIRHVTLNEFQPLRLFPHLHKREKGTNSTKIKVCQEAPIMVMPVSVLCKLESMIYHPGKSRFFEVYSVNFFYLSTTLNSSDEDTWVLLGRNTYDILECLGWIVWSDTSLDHQQLGGLGVSLHQCFPFYRGPHRHTHNRTYCTALTVVSSWGKTLNTTERNHSILQRNFQILSWHHNGMFSYLSVLVCLIQSTLAIWDFKQFKKYF